MASYLTKAEFRDYTNLCRADGGLGPMTPSEEEQNWYDWLKEVEDIMVPHPDAV